MPAPKTVRVFTVARFINRHDEARAVRNAVNVWAWRNPTGLPSGAYSVKDPVGLIGGREGSKLGEGTVIAAGPVRQY